MDGKFGPGRAERVVLECDDAPNGVDPFFMQPLEKTMDVGNGDDLLRPNLIGLGHRGPVADISQIAFHVDHDRVHGGRRRKMQERLAHRCRSHTPK